VFSNGSALDKQIRGDKGSDGIILDRRQGPASSYSEVIPEDTISIAGSFCRGCWGATNDLIRCLGAGSVMIAQVFQDIQAS